MSCHALSTQHSALSTQHSALSTQHSALSTQHSALSIEDRPNPESSIHAALFRRAAIVSGAVLLAGQLAGCATPTAVMSPLHPYDAYTEDVFKSKINESLRILESNEVEYYVAATSVTRREQIREQNVGILLKYIDEYWRKYRSSFYGVIATTKTSTEVIAGGLSGASVITTPLSAAKLLSTLSAGVTALGVSAQKNFLQDNAADILLAQMEADRQAIGLRIRVGLAKPISEYGLATAMNDVAEYAAAMSVPSALTSIRAATGAKIEADKKALAEKTRSDLGNTDNSLAAAAALALELSNAKESIKTETELLKIKLIEPGRTNQPAATQIDGLNKLQSKYSGELELLGGTDDPAKLLGAYLAAEKEVAGAANDNQKAIALAKLHAAQAGIEGFRAKLNEITNRFHDELKAIEAAKKLEEAEKSAKETSK